LKKLEDSIKTCWYKMYQNGGRFNYRDNGYRGQGFNRRDQYGQTQRRQLNPRVRREGGTGWGSQGGLQRRGWGGRGRGGNYNRMDNRRRNQGNQMLGAKRRYSNENYRSSKRQRTSYYHLPLTTIILAQPGDKTGEVPKLVYSRFYDCTRDAKICKDKYSLQLNISRKAKTNRKTCEDRVSIPVPLDNIEAVGILSGMNPFEEMVAAHYEQNSLNASIDSLRKEIQRLQESHVTKAGELNNLPEMEEVFNDKEVKTDDMDDAAEVQVREADTEEMNDLPQVEDDVPQNQELNEEEKKKEEEELARQQELERKRKLREQQIAERESLESSIKNIEGQIEVAVQSLTEKQEKLNAVVQKFGDELKWFEDGTEGAEDAFLAELQCDMRPIVAAESEMMDASNSLCEEENPAVAEHTELETGQQMLIDDETNLENQQNQNPNEMIVPVEGFLPKPVQNEGEAQCMDTTETTNMAEMETAGLFKITEKPVRILILLKKPLDKFYASNTKTTICNREAIELTSMIILEVDFKHNPEEYIKLVNDTLEGPWRDIYKEHEKLFNTPFSAEKTLQYLVKSHIRKEVYDTTIVTCHLCEKHLMRMEMENHLKQLCMLREEPCKYCEEVLIYKDMKQHLEGDCPRYIVPCPQRCWQNNLERCKIEEHLNTCMNTVVDCRYKSYGCKVQIKRRNVRKHKYDGVTGHLELLEGRMGLLTNYLLMQHPSLREVLHPPEETKQETVIAEEGKGEVDGVDKRTEFSED